MKNALDLRALWYVPLQVLGRPGAITSSARACLPGCAPKKQVSLVLVFELAEDAQKYYEAYRDAAAREWGGGFILGEHQIHALTPQQVHDTFMIPPKTRQDLMHIPVAVFHEDAEEILDLTRKEGPSKASEAATLKAAMRAQQI